MATTRRPQINHKACDHAATPEARKACRKAHRAAEAQAVVVVATPEPNLFRSEASSLSHGLAYLADGTPVPACSKRATKGTTHYREGWYAGMATCNKCSGIAAENRGRAR